MLWEALVKGPVRGSSIQFRARSYPGIIDHVICQSDSLPIHFMSPCFPFSFSDALAMPRLFFQSALPEFARQHHPWLFVDIFIVRLYQPELCGDLPNSEEFDQESSPRRILLTPNKPSDGQPEGSTATKTPAMLLKKRLLYCL
jgi:hypothetical protein